jgi:hypothetical protein
VARQDERHALVATEHPGLGLLVTLYVELHVLLLPRAMRASWVPLSAFGLRTPRNYSALWTWRVLVLIHPKFVLTVRASDFYFGHGDSLRS